MVAEKSIITSIRPRKRLKTKGIVGHSDEMNSRMEENITITERKITMGMKKAQGMQTK